MTKIENGLKQLYHSFRFSSGVIVICLHKKIAEETNQSYCDTKHDTQSRKLLNGSVFSGRLFLLLAAYHRPRTQVKCS